MELSLNKGYTHWLRTLPQHSGYLVAIKAQEYVLPVEALTIEDFLSYAYHVGHCTEYNIDTVGYWIHEGNIYFDVCKHVDNLDAAKALGKEQQQIAIFDLSTKQEITL